MNDLVLDDTEFIGLPIVCEMGAGEDKFRSQEFYSGQTFIYVVVRPQRFNQLPHFCKHQCCQEQFGRH